MTRVIIYSKKNSRANFNLLTSIIQHVSKAMTFISAIVFTTATYHTYMFATQNSCMQFYVKMSAPTSIRTEQHLNETWTSKILEHLFLENAYEQFPGFLFFDKCGEANSYNKKHQKIYTNYNHINHSFKNKWNFNGPRFKTAEKTSILRNTNLPFLGEKKNS